jgi:hypothetical protein
MAGEIGARAVEAQVLMDLGRLRAAKGRKDEAHECLSKAVDLFEKCGADVYLEQAREELAALQAI